MNNHEQHQPGLGGALSAVYGVVPEAREVRVSRSFGQFVVAVLRQAKRRVWEADGGSNRKIGGSPVGRS